MSNSNRTFERESYWRGVLKQYSESGLSIRAFCQKNRISEGSFFSWRKRIQSRDADTAAVAVSDSSPNVAKLLSVDIIDPADSSKAQDSFASVALLEIATPNGFTLRVPRTMDPKQLGELLSVITGVATC